MPIVSGDILLFLSGGSGNTDPNASLGGVISTTQIVDNTLHNLFNKVTGDQSLAGYTDYRAYYYENNHGSLTLENSVWWIQQNTSDNELYIGLDPAGVNVTIQTVGSVTTAPTGVTFSQPASKGAGLSIGNIPNGQFAGEWVKRTVPPATTANNSATFILKLEGDTQA